MHHEKIELATEVEEVGIDLSFRFRPLLLFTGSGSVKVCFEDVATEADSWMIPDSAKLFAMNQGRESSSSIEDRGESS